AAAPAESIASVFRRAETLRPTVGLTEPEIAFRERIEESVAYHLVSDVSVGVLLSSGIDSSALAAIGNRLSREPLRTFTVAFEEFLGRAEDEAPLAERFAADLGTIHTTRVVSRDEFRSDLPRFLERMDQPTIDGLNTWFASKAVREGGVKVALSGIGGDELFGGYPSFRMIPRILRVARTPAAWALRALARHPKKRLLHQYGSTWEGAYLLQRGLFLPHELRDLMGADAEEGLERLRLLDLFAASLDPDPGSDFARVATLESSHYLRNQLLRDTDWASMSHSVEVRTPLVDVAFLRQVAPLVLDHRRHCKAVLGSMLPPWLAKRPKTGFLTPAAEWMRLPPDGTTTRMRSWARFVFDAVAGT
ncbi:MAG TPA: asparagine synthase C-terminal domain-containing protein, partial [Thermoanaerobaculia bacterium]|nr:asparagine synthase C-terminal domain-containing protein [Thermoanaerobaculia bacterium]